MALVNPPKRIQYFLEELKELFPQPRIALQYKKPHELLFAVILSAQTTDAKVNEVTEKLFLRYPTLRDYVGVQQSVFAGDIRQIGLFRMKAKNILASAKKLYTEYGGKIPRDLETLITFPGVGRKTANVVLAELYGKSEGIAVDTHVQRLSRLFGFSEHDDAVKIERDLMRIIPKKEWLYFTHRMVWYGRTYCKARCKHDRCPLRGYIYQK